MAFSHAQQATNTNLIALNKLPPQNLEAEQAVIASVLLDNHAINSCHEIIQPNDFYKEAHRIIYQAMVDLNERNEPTDLVTLPSYLDKHGQLESVGGASYLSQLVDSMPNSANVTNYAKLVREHAIARQLIQAGSEIVASCYDTSGDVYDNLDLAEAKIFNISERKDARSFTPVSALVKSSYRMIEELFEKQSPITGLATGFSDIDKLTAGLQKSDLVIVAARPSMGKTAFALNLVENVARQSQSKVAVYSLEMSKESLVMRMLSSMARIDSMRVRTGELRENDWPKLIAAADQLAHMNVFIDDSPAQSTLEVRAKARRLAREQGGLDLIMVDYLQLMRAAHPSHSREQEISEISRSLKALAKELSVPVVALSQLNRSVESRQNKRPMMSDLRESGAIEQDADVIAFIYRDEVYNPETPDKGVAEIIVGKQRNGAIGTVRLAFLNQYVRFEDLMSQGYDAPPPPEPFG